MRLRVRIVRQGLAVLLGVVVAACAGGGTSVEEPVVSATRTISVGPAADYPMVLGDPFVVDGVTYTPSDALNVDEIGFAAAEAGDVPGITAAHRTLPLPSYVEVTALDSGKTALVRVERRGPMTGDRLIALSAGALAQLAIADGAPVRVRRVNPPEDDRAELRRGQAAPLRMETPPGLLTVLRKRLPSAGSASLGDPRQAAVSGTIPDETGSGAPVSATASGSGPVSPASLADAEPSAPSPAGAAGNIVIQVGAFAVRQNADRLAERIGGTTVTSGRLTLVRAGPFSDRGQAEQALAKLRAQGYSDARIVTLN